MRKIKSFKLFESKSFSYDDCIDLIDDIKSLEYIIDEAGDYYKVSYDIVFKVVDEKRCTLARTALPPNSAKKWIDNCNMNGVEFEYEGIWIEIKYDLNKIIDLSVKKLKDLSLHKLNDLCQRYSLLLGEHLNYVGSSVKNVSLSKLSTSDNKKCLIKINLL